MSALDSKVRFYRKFGGEPLAAQFKRYLRIAYTPRLFAATLGSPFSPKLGRYRQICRHLLRVLLPL